MIKKTHFALVILVTVLCTGAVAAAQESGTAPQPAADRKIYLDVVVGPKSGAPVAGLQQQDFTLLDNKSPQAITLFQAFTGREAPIQVVLVIDAINTDAQNIGYQRLQIDKFLRAEGGHLAYPIAIAVATDKGVQIAADFSSDGNALSTTLDQGNIALRFIGRSAGFYGAAERLQYSLNALHQLAGAAVPRPTRKIVIWISPGWPLLSGPEVELSSKQQQELFADIVNFSTQLLQNRITLDSVNPIGAGESVLRANYYQEFLKGVSKPSQVNAGNLALPVLAIQSGGVALDFNNDLTGLLQQCISGSAPYYEIGFDGDPAEQPGEYHQLEVKVAKPGLIARTRQGYYAEGSRKN
jgi:VWFA-related protein